jgi:hypothetical protein
LKRESSRTKSSKRHRRGQFAQREPGEQARARRPQEQRQMRQVAALDHDAGEIGHRRSQEKSPAGAGLVNWVFVRPGWSVTRAGSVLPLAPDVASLHPGNDRATASPPSTGASPTAARFSFTLRNGAALPLIPA